MNNPKNYRAMLEPFASVDAANEALNGFQTELFELRNKYRIRDITMSLAVDIIDDESEGGEYTARIASHIGSSRNFVELAAYALGEARAADEKMYLAVEALGKSVGGKRK